MKRLRVFGLVFLVACVETPAAPGINDGQDLGPGIGLTDSVHVPGAGAPGPHTVAFAADNSEIFFAATTPETSPGIRAVNVTTRAVRRVAATECCPEWLRIAPDGSALFLSVGSTLTAPIHRIATPAGPVSTVGRGGRGFILSPDGRFLLHTIGPFAFPNIDGDSIARIDLSNNGRVVARIPGTPVATNREATEVITSRTVDGNVIRHERFRLDGQSQGVVNDQICCVVPDTVLLDAAWAGTQPRLLLADVRPGFSGGVTIIFTNPLSFAAGGPFFLTTAGDAPRPGTFSWAPDSAALAIWLKAGCAPSDTPCSQMRYVLHVKRPGTSTFAPAAVLTSPSPPHATTFSRDLRRVAYASRGHLYLVILP